MIRRCWNWRDCSVAKSRRKRSALDVDVFIFICTVQSCQKRCLKCNQKNAPFRRFEAFFDLSSLAISQQKFESRVARFGALAPRWRFQNWDGAQKFHCGAERQMALWQLKWRSLWRFDSWDGAYYEILTIEMALWQKNDQKQAKNDQNFKKKLTVKNYQKQPKMMNK